MILPFLLTCCGQTDRHQQDSLHCQLADIMS